MPKKTTTDENSTEPTSEVTVEETAPETETVQVSTEPLVFGGKKLVIVREDEDGYVYATDEEGTNYKLHYENGKLFS